MEFRFVTTQMRGLHVVDAPDRMDAGVCQSLSRCCLFAAGMRSIERLMVVDGTLGLSLIAQVRPSVSADR